MSRLNRTYRGTLAVAWAAASLMPARAQACGGFFCAQTQGVNQSAERIVFAQNDDGTVTAVIEIMYQGPADKFSWLLPISSVPEQVQVGSSLSFQRLQQATNPQYLMSTSIEGACDVPPSTGTGGAAGGLPTDDAEAAGGAAADGGVTVEASGFVGAFEWAVILGRSWKTTAPRSVTWSRPTTSRSRRRRSGRWFRATAAPSPRPPRSSRASGLASKRGLWRLERPGLSRCGADLLRLPDELTFGPRKGLLAPNGSKELEGAAVMASADCVDASMARRLPQRGVALNALSRSYFESLPRLEAQAEEIASARATLDSLLGALYPRIDSVEKPDLDLMGVVDVALFDYARLVREEVGRCTLELRASRTTRLAREIC